MELDPMLFLKALQVIQKKAIIWHDSPAGLAYQTSAAILAAAIASDNKTLDACFDAVCGKEK